MEKITQLCVKACESSIDNFIMCYKGTGVDIHVIFKFSVLSVLMLSLFDVTDRSCHKLPLAAKVLRMDEKCQLFSRKMWGNYVIMHP